MNLSRKLDLRNKKTLFSDWPGVFLKINDWRSIIEIESKNFTWPFIFSIIENINDARSCFWHLIYHLVTFLDPEIDVTSYKSFLCAETFEKILINRILSYRQINMIFFCFYFISAFIFWLKVYVTCRIGFRLIHYRKLKQGTEQSLHMNKFRNFLRNGRVRVK